MFAKKWMRNNSRINTIKHLDVHEYNQLNNFRKNRILFEITHSLFWNFISLTESIQFYSICDVFFSVCRFCFVMFGLFLLLSL